MAAPARVSKTLTQPLTVIFRFLQARARIQIWLYEQAFVRIEGRIIGFDEFMNVVLDDAEELNTKLKSRKPLGRILLKGDNIALIQTAAGGAAAAASSGAGAASAAAAMSEAP